MSRLVVAFDFDGTITQTDAFDSTEEPTPNLAMIAKVKEYHSEYHFIVIFTARPSRDRSYIAQKLREWDVPFDSIRTDKLRYDIFYEDRAVSPQDPRWPK